MAASVVLDGRSLAIEDVVAVARHGARVTIAPRALDAVRASRRTVEGAIARGATIYGVTTGFGKLAHVRIPPERARQLQLNLIRSHASGVGDPLSEEAVRAMMLLRANVLVRGTSGVRPALPELIVAMLNKRVHPRVPSPGSVGASGDLAPLAHLALAMIGEGEDGGAAGRREAACDHRQPARVRRRGALGRQLPRPARGPRPRRAGDRPGDARRARRTADRAHREPRPVLRAAGLPGGRSGDGVGVHDAPDRGRGARGRLSDPGDARKRAVGTDGREPGGRRAHGNERGMEGRADSRERDPHRRDRAVGRGAGARVPEAAPAGARRGGELRGGSGRGPAPARRPPAHGGYRTSGGGDSRGKVRSGGDMSAPRVVRAPRGPQRSCKGWIQEAALRMLMNNLDPEVAERPDELIVYGGTGKAVRDWASFDAVCRTLSALEDDETLLVQSGKPVGVFTTHPEAPRVLIANANLVGRWATWEVFRELERKGLIMYGQMTAGSWIYIGTQGILQGTYETFGAVARRHFAGSLKGRIVLTGGLGGMGGAQPLAATMNDGICLAVEVDPARVQRRLDTRYLDRSTASLDEALRWCDEAKRAGRPLSVGLVGNCAEVLPELARRGFVPDVLTDQTSAHDALQGYIPPGLSVAQAAELRRRAPQEYLRRSVAGMATHVRAMLDLRRNGAVTFDYGNNIRTQARDAGVADAFEIPGFVPEYIRPLFCEGKGPFRWVTLSGDAQDLHRTDRLVLELFPENEHLRRWITLAQQRVAFQGLPARICWLGQGERARFGCALNDLGKQGA